MNKQATRGIKYQNGSLIKKRRKYNLVSSPGERNYILLSFFYSLLKNITIKRSICLIITKTLQGKKS